MTRRQSFFEATKLKNIWNKTIDWENLTLATVMWHTKREWKIVDTKDFNVIKEREYTPIAEFHTQQQMWEYIKSL